MKTIYFKKMILFLAILNLTSCSSASLKSTQPNQPVLITENISANWEKLQHTSVARLSSMQNETTDTNEKAWVELALISKRNSVNTQALAHNLIDWRSRYPTHIANSLFPNNEILSQLNSNNSPRQIAVLLPQHGSFSASGNTIREGFLNAYYADPNKISNQTVKFYDTSNDQDINIVYQKAIAEGADFVIGPLLKNNVQELSASPTLKTPILALNYTNHAAGMLPHNFYEFGLLPEDETSQIVNLARKTGVKEALVIAPHSAWGKRLVDSFQAQWQTSGGTIRDTWYYDKHNDFNKEVAHLLNVDPTIDKQLMEDANDKQVLEHQRRQDFDVIFLFSQPHEARIIVPLLRYYYAGNIPIYANAGIYTGKTSPTKDSDLKGVIICDIPWNKKVMLTRESDAIRLDRLYAVGQDAYLLSQLLTRLSMMPHFPIYGTTGALTLTTQQVHRRLPCMTIKNGQV